MPTNYMPLKYEKPRQHEYQTHNNRDASDNAQIKASEINTKYVVYVVPF